jgi:DNA repair protein RadC
VTRQIVTAGSQLDIELLDHLVIGKQRFISMRERGVTSSVSREKNANPA